MNASFLSPPSTWTILRRPDEGEPSVVCSDSCGHAASCNIRRVSTRSFDTKSKASIDSVASAIKPGRQNLK